ncbi:transmembrane signal receptor [Lithospermum erythrorhizon]|uniref:Transmembrane signal receptor n=1 Tax=Lithospermum erythrorhizon TaxID=34254 RepID=A0AAV3RQK3_LITER
MFTLFTNSIKVILLLYVDDIILTGSCILFLSKFINILNFEFDISDQGKLHYFLGVQVTKKSEGLFLDQAKYIAELLKKHACLSVKPVKTPSCVKHDWHDSTSEILPDPTVYRSLVGGLRYLFFTRPDITFDVNLASQFMHKPTQAHLQGIKRILRYLAGTINHGLLLHKVYNYSLSVYSDSDWAGCQTRRSTTGFYIYLGSNIISWSSKKQQTVARSSTKAEYRALASAASKTTWIQQLLGELHISIPKAPVIFRDNISAMYLFYNLVLHSRSKRIHIDYHFVREKISLGDLVVKHISTHSQLANVLTKSLSTTKFEALLFNLNLRPPG